MSDHHINGVKFCTTWQEPSKMKEHESKALRKMLCKAGDREAKAKMAYEENISFESDAEDLL